MSITKAAVCILLALILEKPESVKADSAREAWIQRFSGSGSQHDDAVAVAADPAGNIAVTGRISISEQSQDFDVFTIKYNGVTGAVLWTKQRDGAAHGNDRGRAVAMDAQGNVVVTGFLSAPTTSQDLFVAKYASANGSLLWEKIITQPQSAGDGGNAIAVDGAGDVVVTGYVYFLNRSQDYYTAKFRGSDGQLLWEQTEDGSLTGGEDVATALALDSAGNVIVTGNSYSSNETRDYMTIKYAGSNGSKFWLRRYNGVTDGEDWGYAVAVDSAGNVAVTGHSDGTGTYQDYATVKYAGSNGAQLWVRRYDSGAGQTDNAWAVAMDAPGNVFVTGNSYRNTTSGGNDIYTAKYDSATGALLWERRYIGPGNLFDIGRSIVVNAAGDAFLTGTSNESAASGSDFYTAKYRGSDGAILWEQHYDGPAHATESMADDGSVVGRHIVFLPDGALAITGRSSGGVGSSYDYATIKYVQDPSEPTVTTKEPNNVTTTSAALGATVAANFADATPSFEYGKTTGYGSTVMATPSPVTGWAPIPVGATVNGLEPHTVYHFRAKATNSVGTAVGADAVFSTANTVPVANGDILELPMIHFNVKGNDTDGDGDSLTVTGLGAAAHGIATLNSDNSVSYTPDATFAGVDSFTYTIGDNFGGTAIGTVSLTDNTPPTISPPESDFTPLLVISSVNGTVALPDYTAQAVTSDNVAVMSVTQIPVPGSARVAGITNVTVTAHDASGNTRSISFDVIVADGTKPEISAPPGSFSPLTLTTGTNGMVPLPDYTPQAVIGDNVGVTHLTQIPAPGSLRVFGITTVTLTAHDAAGNTNHVVFDVAVVDGTNPALTVPEAGFDPVTISTGAGGTAALPNYAAQAVTSDNVAVMSVTQIPVPGSARVAGVTTVTLTARDEAGNTTDLIFDVTVTDGTNPDIAAPPGGFNPLEIVAAADGTIMLPDYTAQAVTGDNVGVASVKQTAAPGSLRLFGNTTVTLTAHDAAGNTRTTSFVIAAVLNSPVIRSLAMKSESVPGAGIDPRIPADAEFKSVGIPAVGDGRQVAFLAKWKSPGAPASSGIFAGDPPMLLVATHDDAPGILGARFSAFQDPLIAPDGGVSFRAFVEGPGIGAPKNQGVWLASGGAPELVLRFGEQLPGVSEKLFLRSLPGYALRDGELLAIAKLIIRGKVNESNDTALLHVTARGCTVLLRTGFLLDLADGFPASEVKGLTALVPAQRSAGHGRWQADASAVAQVTLANGRKVILQLTRSGTVVRSVSVGDGVPNLPDTAILNDLGLPALETAGRGAVVRATLVALKIPGLPPVVTPENDTILAYSPQENAPFSMFVREGDAAPDADGARFASFLDPVVNDQGALAFSANLTGDGITPANRSGLWYGFPGEINMLAREGGFVPDSAGAPTRARWDRFISLALPGGIASGPVFTAAIRGHGITALNNLGVWAVDSTGLLRALIRTGDLIEGKVIAGIHGLTGVSGALGASRGFNARGSIAVRVSLSGNGQAILRIDVPDGKARLISEP